MLAFAACVAFGKGSGSQPGSADTLDEIVVVALGTARIQGFADLGDCWVDRWGWAMVVGRWVVVAGRC